MADQLIDRMAWALRCYKNAARQGRPVSTDVEATAIESLRQYDGVPAPTFTAPLAAPIRVEESQAIMRAQSILSGPEIGACPPLTYDQAVDVLAWAKQ